MSKLTKTQDIYMRDPFVLVHDGKYYLYGSRGHESQFGFDVYISEDLENWEGPKSVFEKNDDFFATRDFWAPEVYEIGGKFYMAATFVADGVRRGTYILKADAPDGEFKPHSERLTPEDWECLDGTVYVAKDGTIYLVFSHEWEQIKDGAICAVKLTEDLTKAVGEPFVLFTATEAPWGVGFPREDTFVTDGPYLFRTEEDDLAMIWSSFCKTGYAIGVAISDNGEIDGRWTQAEKPLYEKDGGHGMIFETLEGKRMLSLHYPNELTKERPKFCEFNWKKN